MSGGRPARRRLAHVLEAPLRRPGLVVAPTLLVSLVAAALAWLLPAPYRASALLRAEWEDAGDEAPPRRPGRELEERRIQAIRRRLAEPALLERTLEQAMPYADTGDAPLPLPAQLERLRSDLRVRPTGVSTLVVEFEHRDPGKAALVPNVLAGVLVRESDEARRDATPRPDRGPRFQLLTPAAVPATPEAQDPALFALAGALLGLLLGLAAAVLAELRDRSVKGPEDLDEILPAPLLAILPELRSRSRSR